MVLFGRANDYLPHIVYAVREMGKNGLGKGTQAGGRFSITEVYQDDKTIFTGDQLEAGSPLQCLELSFPLAPMVEKVGISCLTPLRLKYSNELRDSLPFHLLIRAALRRISTLEEVYGDGEPELDYKGIAARATEVRIGISSCKWHEIKRYSNRQQNAMMLGGIEGQIVYEGQRLAEFLPLLHYCEQTHLGKQTSFGLGKIEVLDEAKA